MIGRITHQMMTQSAQRNLQLGMTQLARLQEQASSQKAITRPSDDPGATANALQVRAQISAAAQYGRNIDDGNGWLTTIDSALSTSSDILNRARDLVVRGANDGSLSPTAREALAAEIEELRDDLLGQANATYLGRTVFAGNSDAGTAFTRNPDGTWSHTGIPGSTVQRRIGAEATVQVDADGTAIFGDDANGTSVFTLLTNIAADLRSGTSVSPRLNALDDRLKALVAEHAKIGSRHAQLMRAEERNMDEAGALEAQRMGIEQVDLAKVIMDLKLQEVNYQSALGVTARVLQPTLMDFLR